MVDVNDGETTALAAGIAACVTRPVSLPGLLMMVNSLVTDTKANINSADRIARPGLQTVE